MRGASKDGAITTSPEPMVETAVTRDGGEEAVGVL